MTAARNTNGRFIKTNTAAAVDATVKGEATKSDARAQLERELLEELHSAGETFWQALGFTPFSWQTTALKLVCRVALYALGFTAALYCAAFLSAILQAWGVWTFLVIAFEITMLVLGFMASWVASDKIVDYVAAGHVSRDIKRAGSWLKSKFSDSSTYVKGKLARGEATVH